MTYQAEVLADSPTGYWRLDDTSGSSAVDIGSGNHAGTYVNAPTLAATGLINNGTAVHFTAASSQELTIANQLLSGTGTMEFWFAWTAGAIPVRDNTGTNGWFIGDNGGTFTVRVGTSTTIATSKTTASVRDGNTHHLVVSKAGAAVSIYLDNVVIGTSAAAASGSSQTLWHFGRAGTGATYSDVTFDEIAIYQSVALDATRVGVHYAAGGPGIALVGSISVVSFFTGVASDAVSLAGTVAAASTLTGAGVVRVPLAGAIDADVSLAGAAVAFGTSALAGGVAATSTVTGALTARVSLVGTIAANSTVTGAETVSDPADDVAVGGAASVYSSLAGELTNIEPLYTGPVIPTRRYAIHWFWERNRYSEAPDPPTACPECGAKVIEVDGEVVCRHYGVGVAKADGTIATADCPYIATATDKVYAQPLPGDPVFP